MGCVPAASERNTQDYTNVLGANDSMNAKERESMNTQHTPTPWRANNTSGELWACINGKDVVIARGTLPLGLENRLNMERAALCVNNYDALLEAAKAASLALRERYDSLPGALIDAEVKLRAAIEAIEKGGT